jgi:hypothetical protein
MRIYLFQAFASNNSGSYTIVGTFQDAATAEEVARLVAEVSAAHDAWHDAHGWDVDGSSPLDELVKREGLRADKPGRGDEWPEYGEAPKVVVTGQQVLVHAAYTATLTSVFGELFYAKGGRVQVEIDHAHGDIAVEFTYWIPSDRYDDPENQPKLDAFEARLAEELPAWTARDEYDKRRPIEPAWYRGHWRARYLAVVFRDLVEGVQGVRRIAEEMGVALHLKVWECPGDVPDPFAMLRASLIPVGRARIILWQVGDRIAAMKALRASLGCGLDEAKEALADLPRELLIDVDVAYAKKAVEELVRSGCDAEVVLPAVKGG